MERGVKKSLRAKAFFDSLNTALHRIAAGCGSE
jgi:hypothetical protein